MLKITMLAAVSATAMAVSATPAVAQVAVYTNQALFDSQRPGITTNSFSFPASTLASGAGTTETSPYVYKGVTFSASALTGFNDNSFNSGTAGVSYLTNYINGSDQGYAPSLTISFAGPVLGLTLGSEFTTKTVNYTVNGQAGTVALVQNTPTFLGFDIGKPGSISVTFSGLATSGLNGELDILGFQTAVPEAATWAMMMVGLGVVGGSLRRRRSVTTRVQFA